jgi:O-antigen ligase
VYKRQGYTADRAHNIVLDTWYSFGIIAALIVMYCIYFLIKNFQKNPYYEACMIFFIYNFLNFPSLVHYLLFLLFFTKILQEKHAFFELLEKKYNLVFAPLFLGIIVFALNFYQSERFAYHQDYTTALTYFSYPEYFFETQQIDM